MALIRKEIETHYLQSGESERLFNEWGEIERLRTQMILDRNLPPPPAVIVDVGGAAGAYAFPLSTQGNQVHLIDPVELHLNQARRYATESGITLASITQGEARRLSFPANSVDAILLLGPLYHLMERSHRLEALREAQRVLKPGGLLFAASISRFASLIDGLARGFFQDPEFQAIVEADLSTGLHRNPTSKSEYFTTAYFHRPEELAGELGVTGFGDIRILAIEGPVWSAAAFRESWNDPQQRQKLLEFLSLIENEGSIQGASAHVMAVAHKPG